MLRSVGRNGKEQENSVFRGDGHESMELMHVLRKILEASGDSIWVM